MFSNSACSVFRATWIKAAASSNQRADAKLIDFDKKEGEEFHFA